MNKDREALQQKIDHLESEIPKQKKLLAEEHTSISSFAAGPPGEPISRAEHISQLEAELAEARKKLSDP